MLGSYSRVFTVPSADVTINHEHATYQTLRSKGYDQSQYPLFL